jgi:elongin-A
MAEKQIQMAALIDKLTNAGHVGNNRGLDIFADCDDAILEYVLPHCKVDQLMYVEECSKSKGRDLSPITDMLWKKFYEREFGVERANVLVQRMTKNKVIFKWKALYEAKKKEAAEAENKAIDRVRKLYEKENERKQKRQVKVCTFVPPSSNNKKRGCVEVSNMKKGNLMKKARKEFLDCREVKDFAAVNRIALQRERHAPSLLIK